MKVAILGDTHFGASKSSRQMHDYFAQFYKFFFDYLETNNITTIIQTGDMFDQRKDVHFTTLEWVREHFMEPIEAAHINLITLAGNHDCTYKNTNAVNSLDALYTHIRKVTRTPQTVLLDGVGVTMYPWLNQSNVEDSGRFLSSDNAEYAVGHFEFAGFPMYPGSLSEHGVTHTDYSKYKRVFSGHFHTVSSKDNILYVGTPYELNWSDCSDPKGFWILDTFTDAVTHIRNPYTMFEKIIYTPELKYDFSNATSKYVKLLVSELGSRDQLNAFIDNLNLAKPHDLKVIETTAAESVAQSVSETELVSTQSMISAVIDNMDTQLDKPKLKMHVNNMYAEALSIMNSL